VNRTCRHVLAGRCGRRSGCRSRSADASQRVNRSPFASSVRCATSASPADRQSGPTNSKLTTSPTSSSPPAMSNPGSCGRSRSRGQEPVVHRTRRAGSRDRAHHAYGSSDRVLGFQLRKLRERPVAGSLPGPTATCGFTDGGQIGRITPAGAVTMFGPDSTRRRSSAVRTGTVVHRGWLRLDRTGSPPNRSLRHQVWSQAEVNNARLRPVPATRLGGPHHFARRSVLAGRPTPTEHPSAGRC